MNSPCNFALKDHLLIHPTDKQQHSSFDEVNDMENNIIFDKLSLPSERNSVVESSGKLDLLKPYKSKLIVAPPLKSIPRHRVFNEEEIVVIPNHLFSATPTSHFRYE